LFSWLAHFVESWPLLHRLSLAIWKCLPPRIAGLLRGLLTKCWVVGAVAVIIDEAKNPPHILLVRHTYRTKGAWGLPGGSLESPEIDPLNPSNSESRDNVLESALRRELFEELGIELKPIDLIHIDAIPFMAEEPGPYHLVFYFKCIPDNGIEFFRKNIESGKLVPRSPELREICFVPLDMLNEYSLASVHARFLNRGII